MLIHFHLITVLFLLAYLHFIDLGRIGKILFLD
jgi:hypothetical protein